MAGLGGLGKRVARSCEVAGNYLSFILPLQNDAFSTRTGLYFGSRELLANSSCERRANFASQVYAFGQVETKGAEGEKELKAEQ